MTTRILAQWVGEGRKGVVGLVPRLASRALATEAGTTETVKSVTNLSDVPENVTSRQVTIYTPARSASQQGMGNTVFAKGNSMWRIEFETESKWENPLMGWSSTADSLENVGRMTMAFDSKEAAMRFADKNGWSYTVREPQLSPRIRTKRFNEYGDNFSTKRAGVPIGGLISETIGDKNK
eukprot:CAMPEP_0197483554 /NCGR_PEP_ID=MMETSP1309-20131121/56947_1 /TAXON_ID=464262 /ORGANISM="Genus nov. species nov., Strain RCC998" /LENGTH=179 /DNA_ID=CAMNT_0043026163 /DNA_START=433 /DNA_END=972 /DNA_ORIENTATION=-